MVVVLSALRAAVLVVLAVLPLYLAHAQERFSIFVGSDPANVERMLRLADLKDEDVVTDLGSGDGRIVIGAAKLNPKLRGIGVEIDPKLVAQATVTAEEAQVAERVRFLHQNAFDADLKEVTVIFMWLWPELQEMLRPKILAQARPGTRVVTNVWGLGSWEPDAVDMDGPQVSLWIVPARIEGSWTWSLPLHGSRVTYAGLFDQRFQKVDGFARAGNRRGVFREIRLRGEEIALKLDMTIDGAGFARHEFSGRIRGNTIEGKVRISTPDPDNRSRQRIVELPWRAERTESSAYFAPTGLGSP